MKEVSFIGLLCLLVLLLTSCVVDINESPIASLTANPTGGEAELNVTFDLSGSNDPDGGIISFTLTFGDGDSTSDSNVNEPITHTYSDDGTYTAALSVTDNEGESDTDSVTITVTNPPPNVAFTFSPTNPKTNETITFDASDSIDPAVFGLEPESIETYGWDFGDGIIGSNETATHSYSDDGDYDVTLTLTDDDGATASDTRTVTVQNRSPNANANGPYSCNVGDTINLDGSGSSDPDGNIASYEWDLDDDGQYDNATGVNPSYDCSNEGSSTIGLKVTDDDGDTDTDASTIDVITVVSNWAATYGDSGDDQAHFIQKKEDEGYIVAGSSSSFNAGGFDYWIMELDNQGRTEWQKTFGGLNRDEARAIRGTDDGGCIVIGDTDSFGAGSSDFWIVKLDNTGFVDWEKAYGGSGSDEIVFSPNSIDQTTDGGYIIGGGTWSFGKGSRDHWLLKLGPFGNIEWQKTYGGNIQEKLRSVQQTEDGGYVVVGDTLSFGTHWKDCWVIKLSDDGAIEWQKTYGGDRPVSKLYSLRQTSDGGYIGVGTTGNCCGGSPTKDGWILKLDASGNPEWSKIVSGANWESFVSVRQTLDQGYIVAGGTGSFGAGNRDGWILKINDDGDIEWQKTYGGSDSDGLRSIDQSMNNGYIAAGGTKSFGAGSYDYWVLKIDENGDIAPSCSDNGLHIESTSVLGVDFPVTVTNTSVTPQTTSVQPVDTSAFVTETDVDQNLICSNE